MMFDKVGLAIQFVLIKSTRIFLYEVFYANLTSLVCVALKAYQIHVASGGHEQYYCIDFIIWEVIYTH